MNEPCPLKVITTEMCGEATELGHWQGVRSGAVPQDGAGPWKALSTGSSTGEESLRNRKDNSPENPALMRKLAPNLARAATTQKNSQCAEC